MLILHRGSPSSFDPDNLLTSARVVTRLLLLRELCRISFPPEKFVCVKHSICSEPYRVLCETKQANHPCSYYCQRKKKQTYRTSKRLLPVLYGLVSCVPWGKAEMIIKQRVDNVICEFVSKYCLYEVQLSFKVYFLKAISISNLKKYFPLL